MTWLKTLFGALIPSPIYGWALLAVFAAGGLMAGSAAWTARGWQMDAAVNKLKADWREEKRLQAEAITRSTQAARQAETRARALANTVEVQHHELTRTHDRLLADNRRLARQLGGLRDPGARPGCSGLPATPGRSGDPANPATGTELSAAATEFLLEFAAEADRAAAYASACHAWVGTLKP